MNDLENSLDRLFLRLWNPPLWDRVTDDFGTDAGPTGMVASMELCPRIEFEDIIEDGGLWFFGERFSEWGCYPRYMPGVRSLREAREYLLGIHGFEVAYRWCDRR